MSAQPDNCIQPALDFEPKRIEVPLTRGLFALVSMEDYELVMRYSWHAHKGKHGNFYARGFLKGTKSLIYMHRLIMKPERNLFVDHINGNGLDNRRENLRLATNTQNLGNQRNRKNKCGFKGVALMPNRNKKWVAHIQCGLKAKTIGYFHTAEEAARAYDAKARELFGEFAALNFPEQGGCISDAEHRKLQRVSSQQGSA